MKTKITNALIIKDFDSEPFFGEVVIDNDTIIFVGEQSSMECENVIDARQNIVMPGFVDAHTHAAMALLKGVVFGKKFDDWQYEMQKKEMALTGNDVYYGALLASLEFAKNGITTVNDTYHFYDFAAKAFNDCGIRSVVGVNQRYSMKRFLSETELETIFSEISKISPLVTANFHCYSIYNADEKMFALINKLASKHNVRVSTHASETLEEVGRCASQNNDMSPIELLESYGFFDRKAIVYSATNVNENDIQILARCGANVCANFGSNHKLACGVAPIYQMAKHGVNVCLGTDGSASNNRLDMFREMHLAATSQNILLSNANCFKAAEVLKMATVNGAKALGLEKVGVLHEGYFADLIMLDGHGIDAIPCYNLFENLVYAYGTEDVVMTMVSGKVIYQNGKYNFKKSKNSILSKAQALQKKFE